MKAILDTFNKIQCLQSQRIYESTFKSEHITIVQFQHLNT